MNLDKPKGIVAQVAKYTDAITQLRQGGYTWEQITELVTNMDADLGKRVAKNTVIRAYYLRALKKLASGTLIIEQESLTKAKRGPKPKQDTFNTEPEQTTKTPTETVSVNRPAKPVVHKEDAKPVDLNDEAKPSSELAGSTPRIAPSTSDLVSRLLSGKTGSIQPLNPVSGLTKTNETTPNKGNVSYINLDE